MFSVFQCFLYFVIHQDKTVCDEGRNTFFLLIFGHAKKTLNHVGAMNILLLFKIMALAPVLNYWGPVMSWTTSSFLIWTKLLLELTHSLKTQKKHSRLGIKRLKNRFSSEDVWQRLIWDPKVPGWSSTSVSKDITVSCKLNLAIAIWLPVSSTAHISNKIDIVVKLLHAEVKG